MSASCQRGQCLFLSFIYTRAFRSRALCATRNRKRYRNFDFGHGGQWTVKRMPPRTRLVVSDLATWKQKRYTSEQSVIAFSMFLNISQLIDFASVRRRHRADQKRSEYSIDAKFAWEKKRQMWKSGEVVNIRVHEYKINIWFLIRNLRAGYPRNKDVEGFSLFFSYRAIKIVLFTWEVSFLVCIRPSCVILFLRENTKFRLIPVFVYRRRSQTGSTVCVLHSWSFAFILTRSF